MSPSTWLYRAGDTSRFALGISLEPDPDKDFGDDTAMRASWGSFQVWVDGLNVCAHAAHGESVSSVHWYLLPLLEWIAANWDPLLHEERLPLGNHGASAAEQMTHEPTIALGLPDDEYYARLDVWQQWWRRHAFEAAADGGVFPRLFMRRRGDDIELSWRSVSLVGTPPGFRFHAPEGVGRHPVGEVASHLHDVARRAAHELLRRRPESPRLRDLTATLDECAADSVERRRSRLVWLSGLEPDRVTALRSRVAASLRGRDELRRWFLDPETSPLAIVAAPQLDVLFGSLDPHVTDADVLTLTGEMVDAYEGTPYVASLPDLADVVADVEGSGAPPHEQGNLLAEELFDELGLADDEPVDVAALLAELGVAVRTTELSDRRIRAVSLVGPTYRPTCLVNGRSRFHDSPEARRFTLAHELCHLLFDRLRAVRLSVVSGPWAPLDLERRANAFAAATLMPRALLDRAAGAIEHDEGTVEWLQAMAEICGTSVSSTLERLGNLGIVDESTRHDLRDEIGVMRPSA